MKYQDLEEIAVCEYCGTEKGNSFQCCGEVHFVDVNVCSTCNEWEEDCDCPKLNVKCDRCGWEGNDSELYQVIRDVDDYDVGMCPGCDSDGWITDID